MGHVCHQIGGRARSCLLSGQICVFVLDWPCSRLSSSVEVQLVSNSRNQRKRACMVGSVHYHHQEYDQWQITDTGAVVPETSTLSLGSWKRRIRFQIGISALGSCSIYSNTSSGNYPDMIHLQCINFCIATYSKILLRRMHDRMLLELRYRHLL